MTTLQEIVTCHPLENHLILEHVFNYFTLSTLKNARLVNRLWYNLSTPRLYEKSCVHLPMNRLIEFNQTHLMSVSVSSSQKYFQNFVLYSWEFSELHLDENVKTFIDRICLHVKELTLCKTIFANAFVFLNFINKFNSMHTFTLGSVKNKDPTILPHSDSCLQNENVRNLELTFDSSDKLIISWNLLLQIFPCTEILSAQCRKTEDIDELLEALKINPRIQLKCFSSFLTSFTIENINSLAKLNYKLNILDLNISGSIESSTVENLLKPCNGSLRELKLFHDLVQEIPININFEWSLNILKSLDLVGDMIKSIGFVNNLPNLEKLNILQEHDNEEPQFLLALENFTEDKYVHKKLNILFLEYKISKGALKNISKKLINLLDFSAYLDDESIQFVFKYMPSLEVLSILGSEVSDEGITGIPMYVLLDSLITVKEVFRDRKYIGDLRSLKRFYLKSELQENISDLAVQYGLVDLSKLKHLELPETAISNQGIKRLKNLKNIQNVFADYLVEDGKLYKRKWDLKL